MVYTVEEKQNFQSHREGYQMEADTLQQAKRLASRNQLFRDTVLVIKGTNGKEVTYKEKGRWIDLW